MKLTTLFLSICIFISSVFAVNSRTVQPPQKPKLVLMPIKVSEEDRNLAGTMETALVEGLQERYIVFSGERVQQKTREIFTKESKTAKAECDETKCMEDIAIAFQAELIAVANVTKQDGGYFLAINIQNIFDNKVIYTKSKAYANQTAFEVIDKLKELTGTQVILNNRPITVAEPIQEKPIKLTASNTSSTLEIGCTGSDIGAEVWINDKLRGECPVGLKVPEGTLQLKVIKYIDAEHEALVEQEVRIFPDTVKKVDVKLQSRLTAEGNRQVEGIEKAKKKKLQEAKLKNGIYLDESTGLIWQDDTDAATKDMDQKSAMAYCENLSLADYDDWQIPEINTLMEFYTKKPSLKNSPADIWLAKKGYWSSSNEFWVLIDGKKIPMFAFNPDLLVRCVRDNK